MMKFAIFVGSILSVLFLIVFAIPVCSCSAKWKSYYVGMRSDLRNMASAQESYFADNNRYSSEPPSDLHRASTGVTVTITEASDSGWRAMATRPELPMECRIYVGKVAARPMTMADTVAAEGEPVCWGVPSRQYKVPWRARLGLGVRYRPLPQDSAVGPY